MKYKTVDIPRPEWCQIGTVVKRKGCKGEWPIVGVTRGEGFVKLDTWDSLVHHADLEPVTAWEPTPGKYHAFWDDEGDDNFVISKYAGSSKYGHYTKSRYYKHVARIAGVDCACSVEDLKKKTDWI